ncbi:MAG: RDD family protein [Pseudomonadales bacterium]|uniref:RDD family protein n=1 Tax=unclassified Ketobacter TaxID=2639109 RepID=UPI000C8AD20D|nr:MULTISPECIES: RDD family protein [unclassified Ketobacter]MAQ26916.1 RDD family protein [Pseudomonadales bacterium]MEC8811666.1 RDD family protein [Pseudomonadota bacterium]TNC86406.1 MAG: RDD family protein [Alcanivorax sp.]HAG92928.1 RDD family protein [Gammaproteobacteria bacterium]MCK5789390.1 RDD family protein [Ketobacter sp.]
MSNAYETPAAEVTQAAVEHQYMGFWMRVLASIIDNIWMGIVIAIVMLVVLVATPLDDESTQYMITSGMVQLVLPFILVVALWVRFASTPGKMAFKGKIVDANTFEEVSGGRLVVRYLGYFVSILPLGLGLFWIAWDKRKQGFHDKLAGTVVIIDR